MVNPKVVVVHRPSAYRLSNEWSRVSPAPRLLRVRVREAMLARSAVHSSQVTTTVAVSTVSLFLKRISQAYPNSAGWLADTCVPLSTLR